MLCLKQDSILREILVFTSETNRFKVLKTSKQITKCLEISEKKLF